MSKPSWIGYELGGRYRIEELLGQGGMSAVYRAVDPNLRRMVAIKLIHQHLSSDPDFVRRFEAEAAAVAQLSHPNIVQVYDFNHDDDTYYMVLEYLPGRTLQDRLRELSTNGEQMSLSDIKVISADVASAVGYAHKRGMIHRDIKPGNVMLKDDGRTILMDFGIAKILGGERLTGTGAVIGTVQYLAPELIQGGQPDPRADLYALGVMMFEMVNGDPPFDSDSAMSTMMMHISEPVPNLRELHPDVPPQLVAIIERALAKDPDHRYQSADHLVTDLRMMDTTPSPTPMAPRTAVHQPQFEEEEEEAPAVAEDPTTEAMPIQEEAPPPDPGTEPMPTPEPVAVEPEPEPVLAADPLPETDPVAEAQPARTMPERPKSGAKMTLPALLGLGAIGLGLLVVFLLSLGGFAALIPGAGDETPVADVTDATVTPTQELIDSEEEGETGSAAIAAEDEPTATATLTEAPTPTGEPTPTVTLTPTETPRPEPYVVIEDVVIDEFGHYSATYEVVGFEEAGTGIAGSGMHVHFFWNTVAPEDAGNPGPGPWQLYYGPSPFREFLPGFRPSDATQLCALIANPDHSVIADSGNCVDLPDVEG